MNEKCQDCEVMGEHFDPDNLPKEWKELAANTKSWSGTFDSYVEPELAELQISVIGVHREDIDAQFFEETGKAFSGLLSRIRGTQVEVMDAVPGPDIDWTIKA